MSGSGCTFKPIAPRRPAFMVGVTGYMELPAEDVAALKRRIRTLLLFLRFGPNGPGKPVVAGSFRDRVRGFFRLVRGGVGKTGGAGGWMDALLDVFLVSKAGKRWVEGLVRFIRCGRGTACAVGPLLELLLEELAPLKAGAGLGGAERKVAELCNGELRKVYESSLGKWPGLEKTPIIVFTSLAPGADSIVAEVVLELMEEFGATEEGGGFFVRAPLPFPWQLYRQSTSFVRNAANPDAGDIRRQRTFDRFVMRIGCRDCYPVELWHGADVSREELERRRADLKDIIQGDGGRDERHKHFYAAGEYMTVHCHLLLALWNGEDEETRAGTAKVVRARLNGPRAGLLANTPDLALPNGGPLVHVLARRKVGEASRNLPPVRFLHPYVFLALRQSR